jgi:hypothetical protein
MQAHTALKTVLLLFILVFGSFFPIFLAPIVHADSTQGYTTLYFTNVLSFENQEEIAGLTQTPPTSLEDSEYPPNILAKNALRDKNTTLLSEEWLTWASYALLSEVFGNLTGENLSGLEGFEGFELLLPGLNRISEEYLYEGNDTITIRGDLLYQLYFSDTKKLKKLTDSVDVALYKININSIIPIPSLIKNTTVRLTPPNYLGGTYEQQIILPSVNCTLRTGDSLLVSVEIIPTNKSMFVLDFLNSPVIKKTVQGMVNRWENNITHGPIRRQIGQLIKNVTTMLEETGNVSGANFTSQDIETFLNAMKSTRLIYASQAHPSSVTIPAKLSEEDIRIYYLQSNQLLSETQQDGTNTSKTEKVDITATPKIWTMDQGLERNKILKIQNVTANLYFYRFLFFLNPKLGVTVTIYDDNTSIATAEQVLTKKDVQGFLRKKIIPVVFNFTGANTEIPYGHKLGIGISLSNGTKTGFSKLKLQYNSMTYPSSLQVKFEETQNIQIHDLITTPADGMIIPGASVQYLFNVTSRDADSLQIRTIEREKTGEWSISTPTSMNVSAGGWVTIPLYVNSTNILKEAYGSFIDLLVEISGNTGITRQNVIAEISEDAIQYNVEILGYSNSINISKGEKRFFYFVIKNNNTGAIDDVDSYTITASSKNHWPLIAQESIRNLGIGETTNANDARVLIEVPKNTTEKTDTITITVTSDNSNDATATITITVNVIGGGIIEEIIDFFDSTAQSLGLNDLFGSDGKFVLLILLAAIVLFLIIILAFVITSKPVRIICTDRIREIDTIEKAIFEVTIKNPFKKAQTYEIDAQPNIPSSKWEIGVEPTTVEVEGKTSKTAQVTVIPTDEASPKDWAEVTVSAKKIGRKKKESIGLVTMIKEGKTLLQLKNVSHWPSSFNPGEKIITSFNLTNNGTIPARNVKVLLYLNGKQKNNVELTLPAGNIADIQIPWIAEKGKNKVRIRVKE